LILLLGISAQGDELGSPKASIPPKSTSNFKAVQVRQSEVADHELRLHPPHQINAGPSGKGNLYAVAADLQQVGKRLRHIFVVVDDDQSSRLR
jgi:hypothetical protein